MTELYRLPAGGRIKRDEPISFTFNGDRYQGYHGDTVASALLANGVRLVGRSFKYHRPRGIVGSGAEEPNAVLQIGSGAYTLPNQLATQVEIYEGLRAASAHSWPSVQFDALALSGVFSRFLPSGFYYKTFLWPRGMWMKWEPFIRRAAASGLPPPESDPDRYDKVHMHCDVLVVGGGPAGLAAALEAGRRGARVILADEQAELGGSLLGTRQLIDGAPAVDWATAAIEELRAMEEVRLIPRCTVFGYYDHNFLAALERVRGHLPPTAQTGPRERLWRIRAREVVLAAGAIERPLVFPNNDRPGILLASAVSTYVNRYAVVPGTRALLFTNNDSAYRTALDLAEAGTEVVAVVDARREPGGVLPSQARQKGIDVIGGHVIVNVRGKKAVSGAEIMRLDSTGHAVEGKVRTIRCDLVAVSGGWTPSVHLHSQSGGKVLWDEVKTSFVPGQSVQAERSAGSCTGRFALGECLSEGFSAGAAAAHSVGFGDGQVKARAPRTSDETEEPLRPMWSVPSRQPISREHKQFVDLREDVSAADIVLAVREGFESIELVKRYTTLAMGVDQGKLSSINGMGIVAKTLGVDIPSVGTTKFRPPYTPVSFGALAGREVGPIFDPVRKTSIHQWHAEAGADFENVGQWKRPWYYARSGETMHDAVNRECLAARNGVCLVDQSTLGRINIQGPDAAEFLNRVYTNNWGNLQVGRCRYGLMLGEDGMVMDDGVTARLGKNHYLMHTTSGGAAHVMTWLERWLQTEWPELRVYLTSVTDHWANIGVVGPDSRKVISKICDDIAFSHEAFPFMSVREGRVAGVKARVFRISFSGELTYEVNVPASYGRSVWEALFEAGREYSISTYGTEALHILRAEKGYIIVGQETDGSTTPGDLGMDWILGKQKDFLGKRSLSRPDCVRQDRKQLVGLLTETPTDVLPEGGQIVESPSTSVPVPMIGHVTSSYYSACLRRSIALALVKSGRSRMGQKVYVPLLDGRMVSAAVASPVFYDPEGARQNV